MSAETQHAFNELKAKIADVINTWTLDNLTNDADQQEIIACNVMRELIGNFEEGRNIA